jgi:hypothetical protein
MGRMGLERMVYHIVPDRDGGWELRRSPDGGLIGSFALKSEALAHGQKRAREHEFAQLIVHKLDYTIEREWTWLVEREDEPQPIGGMPEAG